MAPMSALNPQEKWACVCVFILLLLGYLFNLARDFKREATTFWVRPFPGDPQTGGCPPWFSAKTQPPPPTKRGEPPFSEVLVPSCPSGFPLKPPKTGGTTPGQFVFPFFGGPKIPQARSQVLLGPLASPLHAAEVQHAPKLTLRELEQAPSSTLAPGAIKRWGIVVI